MSGFERVKKKLLPIFIALAAASVWTFALLYSQNILFFNRHWVPYSSLILGLHESMIARYPIAGYSLRATGGKRKRVVSKKAFHWNKLDLDVTMAKNGIIQFGVLTEGVLDGFDVSANQSFPTRRFRSDLHEKFLLDQRMNFKKLTGQFHVTLEREESFTRLFVDGELVYFGPNDFKDGKIFVEVYEASVSSVNITGSGLTESLPFSREENFGKYFLPTAAIFTGLSLLVPVQVPLTLLLGGIIWTSFDYTFYSRKVFRYDPETKKFSSPRKDPIDIEGLRYSLFEKWFVLLDGEIADLKTFAQNLAPRAEGEGLWIHDTSGPRLIRKSELTSRATKRILIFGGSMTSGWGTSGPEMTYPAVFRRKLAERFGPDVVVASYTTVNPFSKTLTADDAREAIQNFRPQIVIFDLVPQATDKEILRAVINKKDAFRPVMMRPPFDLPGSSPDLVPLAGRPEADLGDKKFREVSKFFNTESVRMILREEKLDYIDTNRYFLMPEVYLSGHLFWDNFHLSDWGHELLGNYLAKEIAALRPSFQM